MCPGSCCGLLGHERPGVVASLLAVAFAEIQQLRYLAETPFEPEGATWMERAAARQVLEVRRRAGDRVEPLGLLLDVRSRVQKTQRVRVPRIVEQLIDRAGLQ